MEVACLFEAVWLFGEYLELNPTQKLIIGSSSTSAGAALKALEHYQDNPGNLYISGILEAPQLQTLALKGILAHGELLGELIALYQNNKIK